MKTILLSIIIFIININLTYGNKCNVLINGSDLMKFDKNEININMNCKIFNIELVHTGKLPINVMGHNIVIFESNDLQKITTNVNMNYDIQEGYLPDLNEIIFKSTMIGGGEKTNLEINTSSLNQNKDYSFICSFPGHYALMKGKLKLVY